jgi:hypothetical protein
MPRVRLVGHTTLWRGEEIYAGFFFGGRGEPEIQRPLDRAGLREVKMDLKQDGKACTG